MPANPGALGSFIRDRRDQTTPESVGLPAGVRRRAPGLRRSELATLAGISVEYLVRIEQGRDRNPSPQVLRAIGDALRFDAAAHEHLRTLAMASGGQCLGPYSSGREVRPGTLALLEQLEPGVAVLSNRLGDLLAHTATFELLARPLGLLDGEEPSLTAYVFLDPRSREAFPDWDRVADDLVTNLYRGPNPVASRELMVRLSEQAGAEFADRLRRHDPPHGGVWRWRHPTAGELRFEVEELELPAADNQQLQVLMPADEATAEALDLLRRRRALRAV
ncbi:transcriptional regulator with XRE-family HTH domain [Nocardioides luteus]|uniref:Transcriptional regulator n=1 Tax=Nocardioides luteus TaxID=1844 RepID=A0ABQ5SWX8_9ACTN|nr:helix-turn-helix transcriptional regulator [Nocardioides luteus]MDR7309019.1 transcriptional regulator with XRE-family HTH domain [Nocardioides luteus]GGR50331.1 transcriptional regulator [Nocardioides luteus]GLJ67426.1 transcriptional regulator [Nocardioides luteus]